MKVKQELSVFKWVERWRALEQTNWSDEQIEMLEATRTVIRPRGCDKMKLQWEINGNSRSVGVKVTLLAH
jgi:hypothetical protein